jgi:twinkle protein
MTRLADVKAFDYASTVRVRSSIRAVNEIMGGYMMGQFTIWTGMNSSGKSTLLGQEMLEAVNQGFPVCAYSGELPAPVFRYWIDLQAAGPDNLEMKFDSIKNTEIAYPKREAVTKIRNWYKDLFFLYDSYGTVNEDSLFEVFEYAVMRYGCRVFMIDNLMTTCFAGSEKDFYRKQSEFVNRVARFSQQFDVHIHLVAHPRKTTGRLTKMDVAGTGDITNRADNVLSVHRLNKDEREEFGCDSLLEIFKNRFSGQQDIEIRLNFDPSCKRFTMKTDVRVKKYGWETPAVAEVEALFNE